MRRRFPYKPLSAQYGTHPTNPYFNSIGPQGVAIAPPKAGTPVATTPVKKPSKQAAKTPRRARSAPKRAATPKQKPAKRRTKQANRQTERLERKLVNAGLARLRDKYPDKYPKGFSKTLSPAALIRQMRPLWAEVCKAEDVKPEDYPLKWDTVARAIGRRKDRPRR